MENKAPSYEMMSVFYGQFPYYPGLQKSCSNCGREIGLGEAIRARPDGRIFCFTDDKGGCGHLWANQFFPGQTVPAAYMRFGSILPLPLSVAPNYPGPYKKDWPARVEFARMMQEIWQRPTYDKKEEK